MCGAPARALRIRFEAWLTASLTSDVRARRTFAASLAKNGSAVRTVLTTTWSDTQAEGRVTKLQLLKRRMYGRGNIDLLRRRVLLAARATDTDGEPSSRSGCTPHSSPAFSVTHQPGFSRLHCRCNEQR